MADAEEKKSIRETAVKVLLPTVVGQVIEVIDSGGQSYFIAECVTGGITVMVDPGDLSAYMIRGDTPRHIITNGLILRVTATPVRRDN